MGTCVSVCVYTCVICVETKPKVPMSLVFETATATAVSPCVHDTYLPTYIRVSVKNYVHNTQESK